MEKLRIPTEEEKERLSKQRMGERTRSIQLCCRGGKESVHQALGS